MTETSSKYCPPLEAVVAEGSSTTSLYSASVSAIPSSDDADFPSITTSDRLWSGIRIAWSTIDLGFSKIRIVRKLRDYAYTAADGLIVYEGDSSAGFFDDTTAKGPEVYYYVLWFRDAAPDPWETRYWNKVWEVALAPNTMPELLWSLLPSMYRGNEEDRDNGNDMRIHVEYMLAPIFREMESLTEYFPRLLDVDHTPGPNLKAIAEYIGLVPNLELTYVQQREEIKAATASYRSKGLRSTVERMATAIAGVQTTVVDYNQNLLITNWPGKQTLLVDPVSGFNRRLPGDTFQRTLQITGEGAYDTASYGVYLHLPETAILTERTVRKLYRSLPDFAPMFMKMHLWALPASPREQFDDIIESWWVDVDDSHSESFFPQSILKTNTLGLKTNTVGLTTLALWPEDTSAVEVS